MLRRGCTGPGGNRLGACLVALLLWWSLGAPPVRAATVYGQGSGLPNLSVSALAADAEGFLWTGTEDGLFRFDGHRFEALDLEVPGRPSDSRVSVLYADAGLLWIATRTRLLTLDLNSRALTAVRDRQRKDLGGISGLCRSAGGWLAVSFGGQVWQLRPGRDSVSVEPLELAPGAAVGSLTGVTCDDTGAWIASSTGGWRFDLGADRLVPLRFHAPALDDGARHARVVLPQADGQLWIGYWNDGVVRLNPATGTFRWFHPSQPDAGAMRSTSVYTLAAGDDGQIWFASNRGLMAWQPDCDCVVGRSHPDWDKVDGVGVIIESLLVQRQVVWAGHYGGGLYRFGAEDQVFRHQVRIDDRSDSLANNMVRALYVDPANRLWLGSYGGGVQWVDAERRLPGQTWPLRSIPWPLPRIESRYVWDIGADGEDGLLVSTGTGAYRLRGELLSGFQPPVESARTSLQTRNGRVYVGSSFGLFRVMPGDRLEPVLLRAGGPAEPAIWSLSEQRGQLWVGSSDGLFRLDAGDRLLAHHSVGMAPEQLPGAMVLDGRSDAAGTLWLPTSGGLVQVDWPADATSPRFIAQPALLKEQVRNLVSLEIDTEGLLWLGTPRGLVRYDPRQRTVERYDHHDGLVSSQLVYNSSASDGRQLHFGTVAGLISFDPAELPPRRASLSPRIARWRLGQGPWRPYQGQALELPHDHEPLQLELTALHFHWPEHLRYLYRWHGDEAAGEFVELGDARTAIFSDLPGGAQTLELCVVLRQPFFAEARAMALTVNVAWSWHQTWWGRGILFGSALLGIYLLVAWRSRQARVQRRLLERLVAQRTQELERASAAMEAANARLRALALVDPLTGLANRRQLFETADRWQRSGHLLAVIMVDIDHFKRINDQHGHEAGDAVLRAFAQQLCPDAEPPEQTGQLGARYGGEEFVWLLKDCDAHCLSQLATELLQRTRLLRIALEPPAGGLKPVLTITVSIGAACARPGESVEALIRRADTALYRVKSGGRDGWLAG